MIKNGADPYVLIKPPEGFPGKLYHKIYCYEHHANFWLAYGIIPGSKEIVHHKNEIKTDNRPENLELKLRAEHSREHRLEFAKTLAPEHGTLKQYRRNCRCLLCSKANADYSRFWKYKLGLRKQGRSPGRPKRVI
jgi:hypothetical protein